VTKLGKAYLKGHHGDINDIKNGFMAAPCLKHYIGYSFPFNGHDRSSAYITEPMLRDIFLPPFEAAIKQGSSSVMLNSGHVNNVPGHANSHYINDILKSELNFTGFTVSDWEDVKRLHDRDRVAETPREAVRLAVMAGVDMSMVPNDFSFYDHCIDLAMSDTIFLERVNDACRRILTVKEQLGLFVQPFPEEKNLNKINTEESEYSSLDFARESIILVKNEDQILPIDHTKNPKLLITGPTANLLKVLNGGWSYTWQGDNEDTFKQFGRSNKLTLLDAIKKRYSDIDQLDYVEGCDFERLIDLDDLRQASKNSDLIILCLGEATYCEFNGNLNNLMIDKLQQDLADIVFESNKPVIFVYFGGRPKIITSIVERSKVVILGFLPGTFS
jgi:beta-glucosidase